MARASYLLRSRHATGHRSGTRAGRSQSAMSNGVGEGTTRARPGGKLDVSHERSRGSRDVVEGDRAGNRRPRMRVAPRESVVDPPHDLVCLHVSLPLAAVDERRPMRRRLAERVARAGIGGHSREQLAHRQVAESFPVRYRCQSLSPCQHSGRPSPALWREQAPSSQEDPPPT